MSDTVHVNGLADLQKLLDTLAPKIERNVMAGALRAGVKPILAQAIKNLGSSNKTGELRDSLKIGNRTRGGTVTAVVKTKVFYAKFVEFGTAAHVIAGKNGGWLKFGGGFMRSVDHPGAKARPFLRPALDGQAQNAVMTAAEYMKKRLATKNGLDTSDVVIEAGE